MEATGIALRSPEMVKKRERESVPPVDRFSQRPASVAPRSGIEEEQEQVGESSQSAVKSQKERIEVMKGCESRVSSLFFSLRRVSSLVSFVR